MSLLQLGAAFASTSFHFGAPNSSRARAPISKVILDINSSDPSCHPGVGLWKMEILEMILSP